jgi:hypothetical protein
LKYGASISSVATVDAQLCDGDEFLEEIRQRLLLSQGSRRENHNKKQRATEFQVGD